MGRVASVRASSIKSLLYQICRLEWNGFAVVTGCYSNVCPLCVRKEKLSTHLFTEWDHSPCLDHSHLLFISEILYKIQHWQRLIRNFKTKVIFLQWVRTHPIISQNIQLLHQFRNDYILQKPPNQIIKAVILTVQVLKKAFRRKVLVCLFFTSAFTLTPSWWQ